MALIKCPECGKDISDKAIRCPHCGLPLNEIHSVTQEGTNNDAGRNANLSQSQKEKKRMPAWLLALIIVGFLLLIGGVVFLCFRGKSDDSISKQDIPLPNITEQGVEPFLLGASMYNIPVKGSFYDTLLLEKRYQVAHVIVHVGLSASEMFNTYKACYISPGLGSADGFGYGKQQFYYPDLHKDIYIMASISKDPMSMESKGSDVTVKDRFYFSIPFEEVKNDSVRSIIINKKMVISCFDGIEDGIIEDGIEDL